VEGYRSVGAATDLTFPSGTPLVLFGQNNSGKSNITKALELVLGGFYPGNYEPDEHEFFGRDAQATITITTDFDEEALLGNRFVSVT
jgi:putative ATP-dependent endonuclease of the OLD family